LVNPIVNGYAPILILGLVSALLIFATLFLSKLLAPSNPTGNKLTTYESGEITQGTGRGPIEIQYYTYILVFLVLDVEILFLVPFAVEFLNLGVAGVIEMVLFVGLLLLGWLYAWKKGALEWVR
jgi:NADH-quinone oxidoreductase subunit A